jgi:hypothetical protein
MIQRTDLPVLKPFRLGANAPWHFNAWHGVALVAALIVAVGVGEAQAAPGTPGIIATILNNAVARAGFRSSIAMSFPRGDRHRGRRAARAGADLPLAPVRASWFATQFFRNSPWLVLLFYCAAAAVRGCASATRSCRCPAGSSPPSACRFPDGERIRQCAARCARSPTANGRRRIARDDAAPDAQHDHPATMREGMTPP